MFFSTEEYHGVFGDGKYRLLKTIQKNGSLRKAAIELNRSYRKAWGDLKISEIGLGIKLVEMRRGGKDGGSAILTDKGMDLLDRWESFKSESRLSVDNLFNKHFENFFKEK